MVKKLIVILIVLFQSASVVNAKSRLITAECGIGYIKRIQQTRHEYVESSHIEYEAPFRIILDTTGIPQKNNIDTKIDMTLTKSSASSYELHTLDRILNSAMTAMQYRLPVRLSSRTQLCVGSYLDIVVQICTNESECIDAN